MCFGIRILSLIQLSTVTIPIQNQKCPKNVKKTHASTTIFPLPFEVQLRLCRLCTCIHRQPKPNLCSTSLLFKHHGGTVDSRARASPSPYSRIWDEQASLRNSACLWCFTYHPTLFSESKKPNPQWVTWSSFRTFVMSNIPWLCSQSGPYFSL